MNHAVVGQASRLPPGRLAPGFVAGETPAKTAGTAARLLPRPCSWCQCAQNTAWCGAPECADLEIGAPSPEFMADFIGKRMARTRRSGTAASGVAKYPIKGLAQNGSVAIIKW